MAEAVLVDRAREDDRMRILRGLEPAAEVDLRARLSGHTTTAAPAAAPPAEAEADADDGEVATIVDFASFVAGMSGGAG